MNLFKRQADKQAALSLIAVSLVTSGIGFSPVLAEGAAKVAPKKSPAPAVKAAAPQGLPATKALLAKGQYKAAIPSLEKLLVANPNSAECQYLIGDAYFKTGDHKKARKHLRQAVRLGRGSAFAQKANLALMKLPHDFTKPRTGSDTRMLASMLGISKKRGAGDSNHPTVIDFYASWCNPCKEMDKVLEKARQEYGEKITILKVDVDDPKNDQIIDQYEVSPIPTVVFLNADGEVVTYSVGYSGPNNVNTGIKKILPEG